MLDDPAKQQTRFVEAQATQHTNQALVLFPGLRDSGQIFGLEVLDVASGEDILLVRDDDGLWYAPAIVDGQSTIPAENVNQQAVEEAVWAIALMSGQQWYEANTANLELFGLVPDPSYRLRFVARDTAGVSYAPVILAIGDANPDHVAYYVWPEQSERIFLVPRLAIDMLFNTLMDTILLTPTPEEMSGEENMTAPVP